MILLYAHSNLYSYKSTTRRSHRENNYQQPQQRVTILFILSLITIGMMMKQHIYSYYIQSILLQQQQQQINRIITTTSSNIRRYHQYLPFQVQAWTTVTPLPKSSILSIRRHQQHHRPQFNYIYSSSSSFRHFATNEINMNNNKDKEKIIDDENDLYYEYDTDDDIVDLRGPWMVPIKISIPENQLRIKHVRASGAGGQNINKVSTCVQIRFHVLSAEWIGPLEVRQRFMNEYKNQISKDGIYQLESQVYRTQYENKKDAIKKLEAAILHVWPRPKQRKLRIGLSESGKRVKKQEKIKQSMKKANRRNSQRYDD